MAGSSAASQGSSTGTVSTVAVTVRVSDGWGSGPADSRIAVMPQRTVVSGSQPASRAEQARITAAETAVLMRPPPCRMNVSSRDFTQER